MINPIKVFDNRTMGFKFTIAFTLVALIPMLLLAYVSYRVIDARLIKEADEKLNIGLKTAWTQYYERGEQMRYGMMQASTMEEIKKAIKSGDDRYLNWMMGQWKEKRSYVDIWFVVDNNRKVITRINSNMKDDIADINGLIEKALSTGKSQMSTEILTGNILDMEGEELQREMAIPVDPGNIGSEHKNFKDTTGRNALALMVVTPVMNIDQKPIGAIISGDVLTNDTHITDAVTDQLPGHYVSVAMNGVRIATNIRDHNGQSAKWTALPESVKEKIRSGKSFMEEVTVSEQTLISTFAPIMNNKETVIGSLDVGIPKTELWIIQRENLTVIAIVTLLGLSGSFIVALITTHMITRPLKILRDRAEAFAGGNMDARIEIRGSRDTMDELKRLAGSFNVMMDEVKTRNMEKERHLKELQAVNEDLESKNRELREANRKIREEEEEQKVLIHKLAHSEKLSSLGEIVSGVAHELNNPLTSIMGFSDILLDKDLPETAKKQLKIINDASHRSKRIIDNLLTFARSYKPEKKYEDLNQVITGTIELKEYQLRVNNIDVELKLDPSLPKTMLDGHQLQQVFLNLINNAEHAIAEKGGAGRISVTTTSEGEVVRATVSDTGKGIPPDIAKKIFDPFFTTKDVGSGTGLGLSISYGIIKEHGGNIHATSRPGEGATFVIELPIVKATGDAVAAASSATTKGQSVGKGHRALILDDEDVILSLMSEVLSDAGFQVDTVSAGEQAIKMLRENSYDAIISDIKMRGMNGKEFYHKLKTVRPEAANRVIFVSGDSAGDDTQTFLKETGNRFLKKPFTIGDLRKVISEHISSLNTFKI